MKAIIVKQPGGAEQLIVTEWEKPQHKDDELLIKVKATAINRSDIIHRESASSYLDAPIIGVEVSGIVEAAGAKTKLKSGMRVMGLVNGGGYAEYAVMKASNAMVIPGSLSFEEAAAIPEVFLTAYQTLYWHGKLAKQETVLIHAAGSGVGTAAIQLAKQRSNALVIATAGRDEKLAVAKELGADVLVNYKDNDFAVEVLGATKEKGANVILDFVGAAYWERNLRSISVDGRWVLIGILGGSEVEKLNIWDFLSKRIQLTGTLLTPRSDRYKAALTAEFSREVLPLFEEGKVKPVVDRVFPFEEIKQAHLRMEHNENIGKIILRMP